MRDEHLAANDRFQLAIELFDDEEFFACHDVLEELWSETLGEEREFLQGLIHAAVALFHFSEGNLGGARKMHDSALSYLGPYPPHYAGIDVGRFAIAFHECFRELVDKTKYPTDVRIDPALTPKLCAFRVGDGQSAS